MNKRGVQGLIYSNPSTKSPLGGAEEVIDMYYIVATPTHMEQEGGAMRFQNDISETTIHHIPNGKKPVGGP